jgi:hypothetical protein
MPLYTFLTQFSECTGTPKATRGLEPISYRGALLSTLLHTISYRGALLSTLLHATVYVYTQFAECTGTPKETRGLEPISYRGALLSTLLHATVYVSYTILRMY